jgi:hypothetical protein
VGDWPLRQFDSVPPPFSQDGVTGKALHPLSTHQGHRGRKNARFDSLSCGVPLWRCSARLCKQAMHPIPTYLGTEDQSYWKAVRLQAWFRVGNPGRGTILGAVRGAVLTRASWFDSSLDKPSSNLGRAICGYSSIGRA